MIFWLVLVIQLEISYRVIISSKYFGFRVWELEG